MQVLALMIGYRRIPRLLCTVAHWYIVMSRIPVWKVFHSTSTEQRTTVNNAFYQVDGTERTISWTNFKEQTPHACLLGDLCVCINVCVYIFSFFSVIFCTVAAWRRIKTFSGSLVEIFHSRFWLTQRPCTSCRCDFGGFHLQFDFRDK